MRQSDPRPWLQDMLEAIEGVRRAVGSMSLEAYVASWTTRRAAERAIEIISEASRRLPAAMKARYPDVPWPAIAAIGNVLRHEYHAIEPDALWRIATQDVRPLAAAVDALLAEVLRDWKS